MKNLAAKFFGLFGFLVLTVTATFSQSDQDIPVFMTNRSIGEPGIIISDGKLVSGQTNMEDAKTVWYLEPLGDDIYRIRNAETKEYLIDQGGLTMGSAESGSKWVLFQSRHFSSNLPEKFFHIQNQKTSRYVHLKDDQLVASDDQKGVWKAQWKLHFLNPNRTIKLDTSVPDDEICKQIGGTWAMKAGYTLVFKTDGNFYEDGKKMGIWNCETGIGHVNMTYDSGKKMTLTMTSPHKLEMHIGKGKFEIVGTK